MHRAGITDRRARVARRLDADAVTNPIRSVTRDAARERKLEPIADRGG